MDLLRTLAPQWAQVPSKGDRVLKSECVFSFDTPLSPGGLYTSLSTFHSVGADYLGLDHMRTGARLYLHQRSTRRRIEDNNNDGKANAEVELAAAADGRLSVSAGNVPAFDESTTYEVVVLPDKAAFPYPDDKLPPAVLESVRAVLSRADDGGFVQGDEGGGGEWTERRAVSRYAENLPQLDNGIRVPPHPSQWRCEDSGMTENLWLNLSTGYIGSGRQNWDGSGGTGAALKHYEQTGRKYPLCVKLGTITPHGTADVFSYAEEENDMVEDPWLDKHLAHWGINMMNMEKTERTMAELELELNKSYDFRHILEGDATLQAVTGSGLIGLENLGNTCYMNSVVQLLHMPPELKARFADRADVIFSTAPSQAELDLLTQFTKIGVALLTERYRDESVDNKELAGLVVHPRPRMFKTIVGRNHPEFSTVRQQDAAEFYQHLLKLFSRAEHAAGVSNAEQISALFNFQLEERLEDQQSGAVRYSRQTENLLAVPIPPEGAETAETVEEDEERERKRQRQRQEGGDKLESTDDDRQRGVKQSEEEPARRRVSFDACLTRLAGARVVPDFISPVTGQRGEARITVRFGTFPRYLMLQMLRFTFADDWTPKKLDVLVDVPVQLDLEHLRGHGLQEGEPKLPEASEQPSSASGAAPIATIEPDANIVEQLMAMGFPANGAKRAAVATHNSDVNASMQWVLEHMNDSDFGDPLPAFAAPPSASIDESNVEMLTAMGFTPDQCRAALSVTNGDVERAADWMFSRGPDELDAAVASMHASTEEKNGDERGGAEASAERFDDGKGLYELVGFASHMGSSVHVGHYVAHLWRDGRWVLFNDEKVALSERPPKDLGYLYLFRRIGERNSS